MLGTIEIRHLGLFLQVCRHLGVQMSHGAIRNLGSILGVSSTLVCE